MSVRIFRLVTKICVKNILRIFQAHFRENVKNTEPGRKFLIKKACILLEQFIVQYKDSCCIRHFYHLSVYTIILPRIRNGNLCQRHLEDEPIINLRQNSPDEI